MELLVFIRFHPWFLFLDSVVEAVAHLDEKFARVEEVRSAERKTIVQQDAAVGDIDAVQ